MPHTLNLIPDQYEPTGLAMLHLAVPLNTEHLRQIFLLAFLSGLLMKQRRLFKNAFISTWSMGLWLSETAETMGPMP